MRVPQPLSKLGPVKGRWLDHQKQSRIVVMNRSRGRCEGCNRLTRRLEYAHIFGRRNLVGEPWSSSPELTMALCAPDPFSEAPSCHRLIDLRLDPALRTRLEETAARRFYAAHKARYPKSLDPIGAVRRLVKKLEKESA